MFWDAIPCVFLGPRRVSLPENLKGKKKVKFHGGIAQLGEQ